MRLSYQPLMGIAAEGWLVLLAVAVLGVLVYQTQGIATAVPLVFPLAALAVFFFDHARSVQARARGVLAPVDGTVVFRRECHDPYLAREAICVRIRVAVWGAYALRSPIEGEVVELPAAHSSKTVSVLRADESEMVVLAANRWALLGARPVWVPFGERVGQGRRCGLRRLSREIELYIPASARMEVPLGARVRCGQTLIATILRKSQG